MILTDVMTTEGTLKCSCLHARFRPLFLTEGQAAQSLETYLTVLTYDRTLSTGAPIDVELPLNLPFLSDFRDTVKYRRATLCWRRFASCPTGAEKVGQKTEEAPLPQCCKERDASLN